MVWNGKDRRCHRAAFNGLERRADERARQLAEVTRLPAERVREMAQQRRVEQVESWEATEYLE